MPFPDRQHDTNISHADNPRPGDYWHEMFCPVYRVLAVDAERVLVQDLAGCGGKVIDEKDPKPRIISRRSFAKRLRYSSMPDKTWADVVPEKFR